MVSGRAVMPVAKAFDADDAIDIFHCHPAVFTRIYRGYAVLDKKDKPYDGPCRGRKGTFRRFADFNYQVIFIGSNADGNTGQYILGLADSLVDVFVVIANGGI